MKWGRFFVGGALLSLGFVQQSSRSGNEVMWRSRCPKLEIGALAPNGISKDELSDVLAGSIEAWQAASCDQLALSVAEYQTTIDRARLDGHNVVLTRGPGFCADPAHGIDTICADESILASTTIFSINRPGDPHDGELIEADLEINLEHALARDGDVNAYDLDSVITHELGHIIGLEHSCLLDGDPLKIDPSGREVPNCWDATDEMKAAVMAPTLPRGEIRREPAADELRAICVLYRERPRECEEPVEYVAGCSVAGDGRTAILFFMAGATVFAAGLRRRGRPRIG